MNIKVLPYSETIINHSSRKNGKRKVLNMKQFSKFTGIIALVIIIGFLCASCDNGSTGNANVKKIGYYVTYEDYSLFYNTHNVLNLHFAQDNEQISRTDYNETVTNLISDDIIFTPNDIANIVSSHYSSFDGSLSYVVINQMKAGTITVTIKPKGDVSFVSYKQYGASGTGIPATKEEQITFKIN